MNALQPLAPEAPSNAATMTTLVGVDQSRLYGSALTLLGRLRFAENDVTLAHVGSPIGPRLDPSNMIYDYYDAAGLEETSRSAGKVLLDEASDVAAASGLGSRVESLYRVGSTSQTLMDLADGGKYDLVAIGSKRHGAMESFFLGSVGRALAIGAHQSFLISRSDANRTKPARAVFATDHSEYANRCFARLLAMNPQGLEHVTVVTAMESTMDSVADFGYDDRTPSTLSEAENAMRARGEDMVARLEKTERTAEFRLVDGFPIEALRKVMEDTGADLLILGAKGHGLVSRVFIGSLALHMVVAEPYSLLVLRMLEEA